MQPEVGLWDPTCHLWQHKQHIPTCRSPCGASYVYLYIASNVLPVIRLLIPCATLHRYVASMNVPGGGKNDIPNRLKRQFAIFNVPTPSTDTLNNIFGALVQVRLGFPCLRL